MRRVVVPPELLRDQTAPTEIRLTGPAAHYASRVLRLGPGDPVQLIDSDGLVATGTLGPDLVVRVTGLSRSEAGESPLEIGILVGLPKGERWEWIVQKCTELGASWVQPVYTARGDVVIPDKRLERRLERWRRIAAEATRQCRRSLACDVVPPEPLAEALQGLQSCAEGELRVVAALSDDEGSCGLLGAPGGQGRVSRALALIGPEGGLTDAEVRLAREAGFAPIGLGPRVLRTETAAVAVCALLQARWGDMR
ncbi:MAG: 16S rRNA (uracil(1498)-N(3))-methyltransferase [Myxococcales bacterium]|nr:16S rRNA (uracil(1498)-N(3))-methyltransferase [Myxococcales bacterium]